MNELSTRVNNPSESCHEIVWWRMLAANADGAPLSIESVEVCRQTW